MTAAQEKNRERERPEGGRTAGKLEGKGRERVTAKRKKLRGLEGELGLDSRDLKEEKKEEKLGKP